jgi:hypothetical protein
MKFDRIVGFGDSWVYGDELIDPALAHTPGVRCSDNKNKRYRENNCFLGLLGKHYNVPVENYGIPGGSLQSTIWMYLTWMQITAHQYSSLILVWLTESDRNSFYNPASMYPGKDQFVHTTWIDSGIDVTPREFSTLVKQFQVLSNCRELAALNYLQTVLFFDGQAARNQLFLLQFNGASPPCRAAAPTLIDPNMNWIEYFRDHPNNQQRQLVMPGDHPNEKGHEIIRDRLITEIDRAILAQ